MIPTEIIALINLIGAPAVFVLLLSFRDWMQGKSSSKQENAITDLALDSNAERKERQVVIDGLQVSNNRLQAEVVNIQLKLAEVMGDYAGRLAEVKEAMQRERDEWKSERLVNDEKFRLMAIDISELKKHREQSTRRITELENQIAELERKLATANVDIDILTARKLELETLHTYERNRAEALSNQITRMQLESASDKTQALPALSVDDTVTPLTSLPDSENPPLVDAA